VSGIDNLGQTQVVFSVSSATENLILSRRTRPSAAEGGGLLTSSNDASRSLRVAMFNVRRWPKADGLLWSVRDGKADLLHRTDVIEPHGYRRSSG
jgi:hypothetical protein